MAAFQRCCSFVVTRFSSRAAASKQASLIAYNRASLSAAVPLVSATANNPVLLRSFSSLNTNEETPLSSLQIQNIPSLTNEQLADTATIPGWDLVHTPPRKFPRGALLGKVVSDKMNKTINVAVERYQIVPKYRKRKKYTRKFMAHDEQEVANLGDLVMIVPCHRISRHKHFMLREIIRPKGQL